MNANGKEALISTKIDRYLFDLEMVQIATRNKLRIKGFEVRLKDESRCQDSTSGFSCKN